MADRLRAAAQAALEALVIAEAGLADIGDADREPGDDLAWCEQRASEALDTPRKAIEQLRAALAEPESSVCFKCQGKGSIYLGCDSWVHCETCNATGRTYPMPPRREWVSLTDEEIADAIRPFCSGWKTLEMLLKLSMDEYRAIEQKLKEKNT